MDRPEWVLWHSFEPGVVSFGLDGVITEIGLTVYGADFARLDPGQRRELVESLLVERRLLLIWDNFETVQSMPDPVGATPPLDEAGRQEIQRFLSRLSARGKSAVIITSRTSEDWLGPARRIAVGGLSREDAFEYAAALLAPYPATAQRRARRAFGELLEWLNGYPLSMRLILPRLEIADPGALLDGLRGIAPLPGGNDPGGDRTASLAASISYSFSHLAKKTRRLLPAISLLRSVADANLLAIFSQEPDVPARFSGASREEWMEVVGDAARVGLLAEIGGGMYEIHPALPSYLSGQWHAEDAAGYEGTWNAAILAMAAASADFGTWLDERLTSGDAATAYMVIGLHRRTLGFMLAYALEHQFWEYARAIAQPLSRYWTVRGLDQEASVWTDRIQAVIEASYDGGPPSLDSPAGALWLLSAGARAGRLQRAMHLDDAELTYMQILNLLDAQPVSPQQQLRIAAAYHQLGMLTQDRGRLDEAEELYHKSLAIRQGFENRPGMATSFHQLGIIAQLRGRLEDAEQLFRRSLEISEQLGNLPDIAASNHQLGVIAQYRGRLDEADDWYRHALAINEELGNLPGMADSYHQLGIVAQNRGRLEDAQEWYRKSLIIFEDSGQPDRHGHQLSSARRGRAGHEPDGRGRGVVPQVSRGSREPWQSAWNGR